MKFWRKKFINEIIWAYTGPTKNETVCRKHDTIFFSKSKNIFNGDIRVPYKDPKNI